MSDRQTLTTVEAMASFGSNLAGDLSAGDVVLLSGSLGAGKTTLARAIIAGFGWTDAIRSPTYNLIHTYKTTPPIMHADLYRVESAEGLGLEEFFGSHICLIEWPDRLHGALDGLANLWRIDIAFDGEGRTVRVDPPMPERE